MNIRTSRKIRGFLQSREDGIALPLVILISALLLGFGLALSTNTLMETEISSNNLRGTVAFYAAQMGMERAIDAFRTTYTVDTLPANGAVLFNQTPVEYPGSTANADYTVTISRRDSPTGSFIYPYPIFYILTSVGRQVPSNSTGHVSNVILQQTLSVSPRTLANYTLFYDEFSGALSFQSTFRLSGKLAVNDLDGVNAYAGTTINGDFYSAGSINRSPPYGVPLVSGNIVENGGRIDFPDTIDPFSSGATAQYEFTGTTRMIFNADGTVTVYNAGLSDGYDTMPLPPNHIISVTGGDAIVEGTVSGRVTVTGDDDILINGDIRYADQSAGSWDTLGLVSQGDIIIPTKYYTGTSSLTDFEAQWNVGHYIANSISGGTWGAILSGDVHIDATMVALTGSSPAVINPRGRLPGELYVYGNSIGKFASVTVKMSGDTVSNGLNENYTENKKLDLLPPPGFPMSQQLLPTFFSFREARTALD
jgi:hypothetical protein